MWQQNPKPMKILYNIYQICFALPILLVLTISSPHWSLLSVRYWGRSFLGILSGENMVTIDLLSSTYSGKINGREKLHKRTSYMFVPNHQGSFDIFLIYGFLGQELQMDDEKASKDSFVGKA